jgi:glycosyltransferase involved in cell wall biosynthesis
MNNRFTIITVCYNAEKYIGQTLLSLLNQTFKNYELIIKDGESTDCTMEIINSMVKESDKIHIISEKDKGIYDAMNQSLKLATGEYIYFLNAGDYFCNEYILEKVDEFIKTNGVQVLHGDTIKISDKGECIRKYRDICHKKFYFLTGDCICHQAIFAKRNLFENKEFDTSYKVCADKEWQLYQLTQGTTFVSMGFPVSKVRAEGYSSKHVKYLENETHRCLEKYCKKTVWIYNLVDILKKNIVAVSFFRLVENVFFKEQ